MWLTAQLHSNVSLQHPVQQLWSDALRAVLGALQSPLTPTSVHEDLMVRQQLGLQPPGLADLHPAETSTLSKPNTSIT